MEFERKMEKSNSSLLKKLESYLSLPIRMRRRSSKAAKAKAAPIGCFTVYVGPEKQRFVMRTEYANHPLFRMLLEDAESEYGFCTDGPLLLPCNVDLFCNILAEMEAAPDIDHRHHSSVRVWVLQPFQSGEEESYGEGLRPSHATAVAQD